MIAGAEPPGTNRALVAWLALVGIQGLVNVGSVLFVDVPDDRVYRYSTAAYHCFSLESCLPSC